MIEGRFVERPNRFLINAKRKDTGHVVTAFCPNTSRLIGLIDGTPDLLLTSNNDPERKTDYTVRCIKDRGQWVGIEASLANDLFERYLENVSTPPFQSWTNWKREVTFEESQFDFKGQRTDGLTHWVEVKSLSSRGQHNRSAFFSGTPSKRGWRHLDELAETIERGNRASCVFVVQRADVVQVAPGKPTHPGWYQSLRTARERGVGIHAYRCDFGNRKWTIQDPIPVIL